MTNICAMITKAHAETDSWEENLKFWYNTTHDKRKKKKRNIGEHGIKVNWIRQARQLFVG